MKKRLPYIQLELFEDVTPETCEPNTQENKENIFELLYKAIKCATKKSAYRTPIEQRTVDIAQQKYLKGIKETDIAQSLELSTERIRQLRVKFIESFMHPEGKNRRFFIYAKYFQESAPNFIGQDPAQVVATSDGTPLPYSLLDFIDMTYFEEYEYARQAFIAPKEQADSLRIHNHFLVLELRNHVTPIALETLMPKLEETITSYGTAFSRESITQLIKGNHQINEDNGQIIIDYAALNLPSQKIKRIIYEHKKIHKKDILRIYNEREIANGQTEDKLPQELNMVLVKKNDKRFECIGKTGYWVYCENENFKSPVDIRLFIKEYTENIGHPFSVKTLAELYKQKEGHEYPLHSIRCYLSPYCVASLDDNDLMCPDSITNQYPQHRWSERRKNITKQYIPQFHTKMVNHIVELLQKEPDGQLTLNEVKHSAVKIIPEEKHKNIFYKIINNFDGIYFKKSEIDGVKYLSLIKQE